MAESVSSVQTANPQQAEEDKKPNLPTPPMKISELPAWGLGLSMGEVLAKGYLESHSEFRAALEAGGLTEEDFTKIMQNLMAAVTKSLAKSTDFLKEFDDDDDSCAATNIYK
jgi:hypothetical protein